MRRNGDVRSCHDENNRCKREFIQFSRPFGKIVGENRILVEFILPEPEKQVNEVESRDENHVAFGLFQQLNDLFFYIL